MEFPIVLAGCTVVQPSLLFGCGALTLVAQSPEDGQVAETSGVSDALVLIRSFGASLFGFSKYVSSYLLTYVSRSF